LEIGDWRLEVLISTICDPLSSIQVSEKAIG